MTSEGRTARLHGPFRCSAASIHGRTRRDCSDAGAARPRYRTGGRNASRRLYSTVPVATVTLPPDEPAPGAPTDDPLAPFSPAVRAWFESSFAAPTQAQAEGWAAISSGRHTLIHAPTGSGKTLAAFLWTLDRLAASPPRPAPDEGAAGHRPRPLRQPAQGADLRRRAEPPRAARRDRPRRRPARRARPRHHRREPDRRHAGGGPPQPRPPPAGHPDHDARVPLPDAHEPGARGPRRRRARDRRRGPRDRRLEARRPPRADPRAAGAPDRRPRGLHARRSGSGSAPPSARSRRSPGSSAAPGRTAR